MARPLRIQFPGAIYHAIARGNRRQKIFRDDRDYQRLLDGLEAIVDKFGFEIFSFVCMPNHIHLFFRTPRPNLSKGMQYLLSGYANWFNTRHRQPGHLFQSRYKGELIENEQYFWNVSRYLFGVDVGSFMRKHSKQRSRDIAAWLTRRLTIATLRELVEPFGLGHPDSVRSLLNRAEAAMQQSPKLRNEVEHLRDQIRDGTNRPSTTSQKKHEKRA